MNWKSNLIWRLSPLAILPILVLGCSPPSQEPAPADQQATTAVDREDGVTSPAESEPAGDEAPGGSATTNQADGQQASTEAAGDAAADNPGDQPSEQEMRAELEDALADLGGATDSDSPGKTEPAERVVTGDWPMWGGSPDRNMVNATTGVSMDFEIGETVEESKGVLWIARLGSQTYGNPVVAGGKVLVGTNNGAEYRPQQKGDRGCVLCFDEKTGDFLWQLTREKLPQGRVNDWPEQGICSTACVEGNRVWVVTNRCELMCLDLEGFYDGENDGMQNEADKEQQDADIVWVLDMIEQLGVFPHNLATSSPVVYGELVYIVTSNGVDESHLELPSPRSPSFLAVNKNTGEIAWEDNTPFDKVLHGQWSSPAVGVVNGRAQVYFPGGDGWLYAMDAKTGEHIWRFDLNPKDAKWELGGRGSRNSIVATPVFYENSILLGVGQDPEHGEGIGHLYRIDATKTGDISPQTEEGKPNPNSGQIWHLGGIDEDGSQTGQPGAEAFRRTLSTVAVHDGLVYAPDLSGRIHCVDFETGKRYWEADVLAAIWGSPMVVDGKMLLGDEDGILSVFALGKEEHKIKEIEFNSSIYSTVTIANGVIFISDRSRLYAIATQ